MDQPVLVLLPGFHGSVELFADFIAELKDYSCLPIAYPPDRVLSYTELIRHVKELTASLPRFVVVGESFSGPVAVAIARDPRCAGLVLCASFIRHPLGCFGLAASHVPAGVLNGILRSRAGAILREYHLLGPWRDRSLSAALTGALNALPPDVLAQRIKQVLTVDVSSEFAAIRSPVLWLSGSHERLIRGSAWNDVAAARPDARRVVITAPHMVLQIAPHASATAVREWMTGD